MPDAKVIPTRTSTKTSTRTSRSKYRREYHRKCQCACARAHARRMCQRTGGRRQQPARRQCACARARWTQQLRLAKAPKSHECACARTDAVLPKTGPAAWSIGGWAATWRRLGGAGPPPLGAAREGHFCAILDRVDVFSSTLRRHPSGEAANKPLALACRRSDKSTPARQTPFSSDPAADSDRFAEQPPQGQHTDQHDVRRWSYPDPYRHQHKYKYE